MKLYALINFWGAEHIICEAELYEPNPLEDAERWLSAYNYIKVKIKKILETKILDINHQPEFKYFTEIGYYKWKNPSAYFQNYWHENAVAIRYIELESDDDAKLWFEVSK